MNCKPINVIRACTLVATAVSPILLLSAMAIQPVYAHRNMIELEDYEEVSTPHIPELEFVSTIEEMSIELQELIDAYPVVSNQNSYLGLTMLSHCEYTGDQLDMYLKRGLKGLGGVYKAIEQETGVNAMFLIAISALESDHGTSDLARDMNNIFGYGAFDSDVRGNALGYRSYEECIRRVAESIKRDYLVPTGKYYRGTSIEKVNTLYCTDSEWKHEINAIMKCIDSSIREVN